MSRPDEDVAIEDLYAHKIFDRTNNIDTLCPDWEPTENNFDLPKALLYAPYWKQPLACYEVYEKINYQVYHLLIVNELLSTVNHFTKLERGR